MWTDAWLGLPYAPLGRGPAYDCLGLFLAVQRVQFGRDLPYGLVRMGLEEEDCRARHEPEWAAIERWDGARRIRKTEVVREGDAVLMRRGRGWHIGVALDERRMLHADRPGSAITEFRRGRWGKRLEGVYRHHDG